jgi:hypothetical protein
MFSESVGELRISVSGICHSPALSLVVSFTANLHFLVGLSTCSLRVRRSFGNLEVPHRQQPI